LRKIFPFLFLMIFLNTNIDAQNNETDSDNDGIYDTEEIIYGYDGYITDPYNADTDNDSISDTEEITPGTDKFYTNPCSIDSDNDGIPDNTDFIASACYVDIDITKASLPGGEIPVSVSIRDLNGNLIEKDGIQFSLHCSSPAVFDTTAQKGSIITGAGTQSVVIQTTGGEVLIKTLCSSQANIDIWASDSAGLNITCFSKNSPYQINHIPSNQPDDRFSNTGMIGEVDMFVNDISIGFPFEFYGINYQYVNIHSNGFLTFEKNIPYDKIYLNTNIPNSSSPNNIIAPFWDDLDATDGTILYFTNNSNAGKTFHTRWKEIPFFLDVTAQLTFDTIIYEKSNIIQFSYKKLTNGTGNYAHGSSATVGVENGDASKGIQYSYNNNSVNENTTILISTKKYAEARFLDPSADEDNDGLTNSEEINTHKTDPLNSDTDSDSLPDKWEIDHSLDPLSEYNSDGKNGDPDNDTLSNFDELIFSTDPQTRDTDCDLISDGIEVHVYSTDPTHPDTDADNLTDGEEIYPGTDGFVTNPLKSDTDNDGINDDIDPIPVYAKLVVQKPSDAYCGYTSLLKLQLWSHDGYLLNTINNFSCLVQVSGSAYFVDPAVKGTILSGAGTNTITIQFNDGEAWVNVKNYTDEKVYFSVQDINNSSVWFAHNEPGFTQAPYNLRSIVNSSNLLSLTGDDNSIQIPIGFNFKFFGNIYQNIKVSTNGYLTFNDYSTDNSNDNIPDIREPNNYIAPFWDDLKTAGGAIYACVTGSAPARNLVIYWNNVGFAANSLSRVSFQLILHEIDSSIEFQFATLSGISSPIVAYGNSATTGIENASGSAGVRINFNSGSLSSATGYFVYDGTKPSMEFRKNPSGDDDIDGVINEVEWTYGTDQFDADTDNDGLSDGDEIYTHLTDPLNQNSDNDKFNDYEEILAGTDPKDTQSYLTAISIAVEPSAGDVIIQWKSRPGIIYTIFAASYSTAGNFVILNDGYTSQGEITSFTDQGGGPNNLSHPREETRGRIYKISVIE